MPVETRPPFWLLALLLFPGVGYLLATFGLPLLRVVWGSFRTGGNLRAGEPATFTLDNWARVLSDGVFLDGLAFSLWLGIAPTAASLLVALPLAALLQANETAQRTARTLYRLPLVVPGIIAGFMILVMFDRGGMASRLATPLGLDLPRLVRDEWGGGAIMASMWKTVPFMTLIISGAMAAIPSEVLAAARTLGASRLTVLWRIQVPLAQAGITAAVLLSFIGSLGSFVIPSLLGPAYPLPLSVHMFEEGFQRGNWNLVYAMGTMLSVMAIAVLFAYYALIGSFTRRATRGRGD